MYHRSAFFLAYPMTEPTRIPAAKLEHWALACLQNAGVPEADALLVANSLVQTSLWGIDSHGVLRLTHYLRRLENDTVKAKAEPVVRRTGPVTAQMDGDDGLGIVHAMRAMELAMEMARAGGVGVVGVSDSSHCGALGLYTRAAARTGLIGFAFTHTSSVAVPHGGKTRFFGTNPLSIAFPRTNAEPVCLDMATTQVAWNRVLNARIEGVPVAAGIAMDSEGRPTTDAQLAKGAIPLGGVDYGYKGYGLALMIDLLCGALNGMGFGPHITNMYEQMDRPRKLGHLLVALDPKRFAGAATMDAAVTAMLAELKQQGDVLFPGEPEQRYEAERRLSGIPVEPAALADMNAWAAKFNLEPLAGKAAS